MAYADRFLSPSRKNWTRSRISSALGLWKVNSSPRTVHSVNVWLNALFDLMANRSLNKPHFVFLSHSLCFLIEFLFLLLRRDGSDFREGELQKDLLLVVHDVDARPIDCDDDVVLRQIRTYRAGRRTSENDSQSMGGWIKLYSPEERKAS